MKSLVLAGVALIFMAGCAQERPLTSYDDAGLCILKGQAIGYGNTNIIPKIQAEFSRRGELSISKDDCDTYMKTGMQDAKVRMKTNDNIIQQSNQSMMTDAIRGN